MKLSLLSRDLSVIKYFTIIYRIPSDYHDTRGILNHWNYSQNIKWEIRILFFCIGIDGDLLNWLKSFLSGSTQCVNVDGITSKWKEVISGIPQDSILGPLIFVIFINDILDEIKFNICKLFEGDCKLYGIVNTATENKSQMDLRKLEKWSKKWQLPFNATKCKVMHFGYQNLQQTYHLNGHALESSHIEKDLRVTIDDNLKFHNHTAKAVKK